MVSRGRPRKDGTPAEQQQGRACLYCARSALSRGMCGTHYFRWRDKGDPLWTRPPRPVVATAPARVIPTLATHVEVAPNGCHWWTGPIRRDGYGQISGAAVHKLVHREALRRYLEVDRLPADLQVDHMCHDYRCQDEAAACLHRRCVNVEHMWLATNAENNARGRKRPTYLVADAKTVVYQVHVRARP